MDFILNFNSKLLIVYLANKLVKLVLVKTPVLNVKQNKIEQLAHSTDLVNVNMVLKKLEDN